MITADQARRVPKNNFRIMVQAAIAHAASIGLDKTVVPVTDPDSYEDLVAQLVDKGFAIWPHNIDGNRRITISWADEKPQNLSSRLKELGYLGIEKSQWKYKKPVRLKGGFCLV